MKPAIEAAGLNLENVRPKQVPNIAPWTLTQPSVLLDLSLNKKSSTNSLEFRSKFLELRSQYPDHFAIFTDGSKDDARAGCASVSDLHTSKLRLPDNASIFSAEVLALDLALRFVESRRDRKFIIFSDSLSVLQALKNRNLSNPLVQKLLVQHHHLSSSKEIIFCWIPSHVGISGNEDADEAAKSSLNLNAAKFRLPHTDFKPIINRHICNRWQASWNNAIYNKLFSIKPVIGESTLAYRSVRKEEVVLARCRIGHTHITHSYLLKKEDQPECVFCLEPFTVKHFLLDCVDLLLTLSAPNI